jgi:hypothetical protein
MEKLYWLARSHDDGGGVLSYPETENSRGIVMISKKHWSPGSDVSVESAERSESGGWIVSGVLAPKGICPDCGLQSRRRHGWRRRRLQDYPAHGDEVTVDLAICVGDVWHPLAHAGLSRTRPPRLRVLLRGARRVSGRLSVILGILAVGGLPSGSSTVWALESAMTRCLGS